MAVSLNILNVTKTFGSTTAVNDVTINIEPGELFFLLGPSGCGKTTLLRSIAGFYVPEKGAITIGDTDVTRLPPHERDTGMVFQSYALWPHMTVSENVAFGLQMRKVSKEETAKRVAEALEMVKMTDRAKHKPNQLSGGQQQRVALARALIIQPRCLLLDEPLSNLDAKLRLEMRTEIRRICKDAGLTAVYVTHDQKEALSVADRLAVMSDGCLMQVGTPREVYVRPDSEFIAGFIGETNLLPGHVSSQQGDRIHVKTDVGDLVALAAGATFADGDKVVLSVRPEVIRFDDAPADTPNRFDGAVHHSVYLGEVAQHQVTLTAQGDQAGGDSVTIKAFDLNPRIVARDGEARATIWVDPQDVIILTR